MVAYPQKGFAFELGSAIKNSFIDYFADFAFREKIVNLCLDDTTYLAIAGLFFDDPNPASSSNGWLCSVGFPAPFLMCLQSVDF